MNGSRVDLLQMPRGRGGMGNRFDRVVVEMDGFALQSEHPDRNTGLQRMLAATGRSGNGGNLEWRVEVFVRLICYERQAYEAC